jgi:hypothetical protein
MDSQEFENQKIAQANYGEASVQKRASFFQHVLLVSSSIFGILVSLHSSSSSVLYIRLVFLFSVVLLALGILLAGLVTYDHAMTRERMRQAHYNAVENALAEGREVPSIAVSEKKRTRICEKISLLSLSSGVVALTVYTILDTLL